MKFWDSSALIPLMLPEPETRALGTLLKADPVIAAWWGTRIECAAAIARLERERRVSTWLRLDRASTSWPTNGSRSHRLRRSATKLSAWSGCIPSAPPMRISSRRPWWPASIVRAAWSSSPLTSGSPTRRAVRGSGCFQTDMWGVRVVQWGEEHRLRLQIPVPGAPVPEAACRQSGP